MQGQHATSVSNAEEPRDVATCPVRAFGGNQLRFLIGCAAVGTLMCAAGFLAIEYKFGSIHVFAAVCKGESFVVTPRSLDLGMLRASTEESAVFRVRNISSKSIEVIGTRTGCSCVVASGLPIEVGPGAEKELSLRVFASGRDRTLVVPVSVFVNDGLLRTCQISIRATVEDEEQK